jgi:hypothetical protein
MQDRKPLSIGQALDRAFALYRQSIGSLLPYCLGFALASFAGRLLLPATTAQMRASPGTVYGILFLQNLVVLTFMTAMILKLDDVDSGRRQLSVLTAYTGGLRRFLPMLGVFFLYGLALVLGIILLIVPGIWLSISLSLAFYAAALDGRGVNESLNLSRSLVSGHWWRTATILTVVTLVYAAVYMAIATVATLVLPIGGVLSLVSGAAGLGTFSLLLVAIVLALVGSLLTPLFYATGVVIYRDLQLRKSGGDLAARIAETA